MSNFTCEDLWDDFRYPPIQAPNGETIKFAEGTYWGICTVWNEDGIPYERFWAPLPYNPFS